MVTEVKYAHSKGHGTAHISAIKMSYFPSECYVQTACLEWFLDCANSNPIKALSSTLTNIQLCSILSLFNL